MGNLFGNVMVAVRVMTDPGQRTLVKGLLKPEQLWFGAQKHRRVNEIVIKWQIN